MTAHSAIQASDSGAQLDRGVRRVLEESFCVDLSGVRLHSGPRTEAFLRAHGYPAAAVGHRVFLPARRRGDGESWVRRLAHEIAHAVQQAQGVSQAGGWWERQAEAAAAAVTAGRLVPGFPWAALEPPRRGHGAAVLAGFDSWEHRLLGDVPSADMVSIATRTGNWRDLVDTQARLMNLWREGGPVTEEMIHAIDSSIGLVTLPGSGCLASYGELNAVADYVANVDALNTMPAAYLFPFLQQIRQESYNMLSGLLGPDPDISFAGAITPYMGQAYLGALREGREIERFSLPLGVNHYFGLLARNACHFAPFAWYRWLVSHTAARDLAQRSWSAGLDHRPEAGALATQAWIAQGYADHFLQDSFAAGHLINKTLVMQWFAEWVGQSYFIKVDNWEAVRRVTAAHQPRLMGADLYDSGMGGLSNDPQAAEEHAHFAERMDATGVHAYGPVSQEEAYHQYLSFLAASPVQLASKQVHDHFNETGLDVVTHARGSGQFRAYGDGKLLSDGAGIRYVSDAVGASQKAVSSLINYGRSKTLPIEVLWQVPYAIQPAPGQVTKLLDWHRGPLRGQAESLFGGAKAVMAGVLNPTQGVVSADNAAAGLGRLWRSTVSMGTVVTPYWDGERLFAGSWGVAYQLDPATGVLMPPPNQLIGTGYSDLSFGSSADTVFIGGNACVTAADAATVGTTKWSRQIAGGLTTHIKTDVRYTEDGHLYAGFIGFAFELDPATGATIQQGAPSGLGHQNDVALTVASADFLLFVMVEVVVCLRRDNLQTEVWRWLLPPGGPALVLAVGDTVYAAGQGSCAALELATGRLKALVTYTPAGQARLAADETNLYLGEQGTVTARQLADITVTKWTSKLTDNPATPVTLLVNGADLFAAVNGAVYQLNRDTGKTVNSISLASENLAECEMATDGVRLFCSTQGALNAVKLGVDEPAPGRQQPRQAGNNTSSCSHGKTSDTMPRR